MSDKATQCAIFCQKWGITDDKTLQTVQNLYEIDQLEAFLPTYPTVEERAAFQEVIGARFDNFYGYMDYQKSSNTFEVIMQWREKTGNFE